MSNTRPNILVIVTDDQRLAGTMEVMPKTVGWFQTGEVPGRGAVTGGTAYPNAVCTTPLCAPSRASILTGRYPHNHGVRTNDADVEPDPAHLLQQYLRSSPAGYRTGIFGKYLNGWTQSHPPPEGPPGFDRWAIFEGSQYFPALVNEQGAQRVVLEYSTDYFADRAVAFIEESCGDGLPWFLYLAPATSHSPFTPDPKYADAPVPPFRAPPSYLEADRRDKPAWVRRTFADPGYIETTRAAQLRMLRSADDLVDKVMSRIAELGEDSSTLAFFTSDHGMHWGEHGLDTKASPYLDSIRVPFYMRWPGHVDASKSDSALVANIDIAPTALAAAEASPAQDAPPMDGRSLLGGGAPRNRILIECGIFSWEWASLLTPAFQYIETHRSGRDERTRYEYYDLTDDPHELSNLLQGRDVENDPQITQLSALLAADRAGPPADDSDPIAVDLPLPPAGEDQAAGADLGVASPAWRKAPGQTRIRAPAPNRLPGTSVFFALARADAPPPPQTNVSGFECSLDGEPYRRCGQRLVVRDLANGPHNFRAVSIDEAGNRDPVPASYEWTTEAVLSWRDEPDPGWPDVTAAEAGVAVEARVVIPDGDGGWYVGGSFGELGGFARANLAHVKADKTVDEVWSPSANGTVTTMALSEDGGTLYIGGAFTTVNSAPRGRLAALDARRGALTAWAPGLDREVSELALSADSVYVVGAFTRVGDEPRLKAAEIGIADGIATGWSPGANPEATLLALELTPERVYVGGAGLTDIGGAPRRNLAELDRVSGEATPWDPSPDGEVEALRIAPDAGTIFVGGTFESIGAPARAQPHAAEVRLGDGAATGWRPVPDHATPGGGVATVLDFSITDLSPSDEERRWSIVIAGEFGTVKARYPRNLIAEVAKFGDLSGDGYPADWDPGLDSIVALAQPPAVPRVSCVAQSGPLIAVAGNFFASGFTARRALAFYRKSG